MAKRIIVKGEQAREKIKSAVNEVADILKRTLGPAGRNVIAYRANILSFEDVDDGYSIAREIRLNDEIEDVVARSLVEACSSTNDRAGDGTTTTIVLANAIYNEGYERLFTKGNLLSQNPVELRQKLDEELEIVLSELDKMKKPIEKEDIYNVAKVSSNSEKIAKIIGDAADKVGKELALLIEDSYSEETTSEVISGVEIPHGFIHGILANTPTGEFVQKNANILFTNQIISEPQQIMSLVNELANRGETHLILIARAFNFNIYNSIVATRVSQLKGGKGFNIVAVQFPTADEVMEDYALACGTAFIDENKGMKLQDLKIGEIGRISQATITKDRTFLLLSNENLEVGEKINEEMRKTKLTERIEVIKSQLKDERPGGKIYEKLQKRIGILSGGIGIIKVGGINEGVRQHFKKKIEDAVCATRAAIEDGIVRGGGLALKEIAEKLGKDAILYIPLQAPFNTLQENNGGKLEISEDVVDPVKVIKIAVQNAVKTAGMLLSTDAAIAHEWLKPCSCNSMENPAERNKRIQEEQESGKDYVV